MRVRGVVAKVNANILGRNWVHVREGTNDLTVTTADLPVLKDEVAVSGVVDTKADFGSGYKFDVMLIEARIARERRRPAARGQGRTEMTRAALPHPQALIRIALLAGGLAAPAHAGERAFPPSRLAVAGGELLDPGDLFGAGDCAECHKTQERDWRGSMHSRAHHDGLYRAFAELARKEAGEETYLFCTACHAPGAVAAGEQPAAKDGAGKHTFLTDEGVTCEVCHLASNVRTVHAGGGGNASLLLTPGRRASDRSRRSERRGQPQECALPLHERSEFCSACHTLLHPHNGLVIENTYEEWRKGPTPRPESSARTATCARSSRHNGWRKP
ncbi:MAG: multiheme c-type cytochrome [Kiritimatiellia bacterium]